MKTKLFTLVFAVVALGACKKEIKLEVKQLHEEDKTAQWDINLNRSVVSSTEPEVEKSCVKFNDEITGLSMAFMPLFLNKVKKPLPGWILWATSRLLLMNYISATRFSLLIKTTSAYW